MGNDCLFLHGSPGLGKTSVANLILKENDFDVLEFNASEMRNQKLIRDRLAKINGNINIIYRFILSGFIFKANIVKFNICFV